MRPTETDPGSQIKSPVYDLFGKPPFKPSEEHMKVGVEVAEKLIGFRSKLRPRWGSKSGPVLGWKMPFLVEPVDVGREFVSVARPSTLLINSVIIWPDALPGIASAASQLQHIMEWIAV